MQEKKIILPISYLPPIEYFVYLVKHPTFLLETHESYPKQTYRNRCKIYSANGILSLSIPVLKPNGNNTKTKDILISYQEVWQKDHWRAIGSAYSSSPYFEYFKDELEIFYIKKYETLVEFNQALLVQLFDFISLKKDSSFTESFKKEYKNELDLRNHFNPKKESAFICPKYYQVFDDKFGFKPNLSIIDLLFSEGPNTLSFLQEIPI